MISNPLYGLDKETLLKKFLVHLVLITLVALLFTGLLFLCLLSLPPFLLKGNSANLWLGVIASATVVTLSFDALKKLLIRLAEKTLFLQEVDYEKVDNKISLQFQETHVEILSKNITELFTNDLGYTSALLFVLDEDQFQYRVLAQKKEERESLSTVPMEHPLIQILKSHHKPVISKSYASKHNPEAAGMLSNLKAETALKISFQQEMIAFLALGVKKSNRPLSQSDLDFLQRTEKTLGLAVHNAKIFKVKEEFLILMAEKNRVDVLARFSEGIDHEIKNPLNAIKPTAQTLLRWLPRVKEGPQAEEKFRHYLEIIIRNVDRIVSVMTRLRNFARPIRSRETFTLEPIPLKQVVDEALGLVSTKQLELDNIQAEVYCPEDLYVFGEHTSLVQVFWNLIVNAYHAINKNGTIRIRARASAHEPHAIVTLEDTGAGIAPENLDRIFIPFFTTKPSNLSPEGTDRFTGTGLGLCFVKQFMDALGGSITVTSRLGVGTTFSLKFLKSSPEDARKKSEAQNINCG